MPKIALIYLSPWNVGGFTTFTTHLYKSLELMEWSVEVLRLNNDKSESKERTLKHYNLPYRNVSVKEAIKDYVNKMPTLITAVARPQDLADPDTIKKLLKHGAKCCVQSTQEFKQFEHVENLRNNGKQVVVIRESLQKYFKGSKFLPHPYVRVPMQRKPLLHRKNACSIAMVATNKHPKMICDVNEDLPAKLRVEFLGKETTHFLGLKLQETYKHYKRPKGFVGSEAAVVLASEYKMNVDLSDYDGDGGGTQYSFLEAIDAGTVNILHRNWTRVGGEMVEDENCLAVEDDGELEAVLRSTWTSLVGIQSNADILLSHHAPMMISGELKRIMR